MKPDPSQQSSFLPDFCGVRMVFVAVLIAELLAIVITLALPAYVTDRVSDLALNSLFIQWIALSCVAMLCITRRYLNALPDYWTATLSYLLVLAVSLIITEIAWWLLFNIWTERGIATVQSHGLFLSRCMGISAIVSALALRYFYIQHQWRRNIESEAESRIQALQSRIRPHFLFNCMNTIASLTRSRPTLAEEAIEDLAEVLRVSLKEAKRLATLNEELSLCRHYLRIESHRLGDRLHTVWDIDRLPGNAQLPALTLQPLIENAIYHGIEPLQEGGTIHISGEYHENVLEIRIDNPLPQQSHVDHHEGNKFAQDNVQQRLSACFGNEARLHTHIADGRYHARITIPYRDEDTDR
ncbi:MAG: histidine kinase [Gammaproteobacteria bacterium]|nr:histidine kinase [Gammaproteobacteria bacterium]